MIVLVGEDRAARHHPGNAVARARLVAADLQLTLHRACDLALTSGRRRRAWRAERREVETVAVPLGFVGWPADGARIAELRCLNGGDVPGIAGAHLGARDATPARLHEEYIRYNAP